MFQLNTRHIFSENKKKLNILNLEFIHAILNGNHVEYVHAHHSFCWARKKCRNFIFYQLRRWINTLPQTNTRQNKCAQFGSMFMIWWCFFTVDANGLHSFIVIPTFFSIAYSLHTWAFYYLKRCLFGLRTAQHSWCEAVVALKHIYTRIHTRLHTQIKLGFKTHFGVFTLSI